MPLESSNYQPSFLFRNGYVSTVYSGLWRPKIKLQQNRERITLSDGDFLDLYSMKKKPTIISTIKSYFNSLFDLFFPPYAEETDFQKQWKSKK